MCYILVTFLIKEKKAEKAIEVWKYYIYNNYIIEVKIYITDIQILLRRRKNRNAKEGRVFGKTRK